MTVCRDSEIPASGWWCCSLNRPSWSLLWKLYICSLGSLVHLPQKITWLGLILHLDLYSNVNSLGIPVLTPQLKIVTLHPYYSLLHSNTLTLHYSHWFDYSEYVFPSKIQVVGGFVVCCFTPSHRNSDYDLTQKAFSKYLLYYV